MPQVLQLLLPFFVALSVTFIATPIVKKIALKMGSLDYPSPRKIHDRPTPQLGGIAIYIGVIVACIATFNLSSQLLGIILGTSIALVTGILDDIVKLSPIQKLLGQVIAAIVTIKFGITITFLTSPFDGEMIYLGFMSTPITLLWLVGLMNTMNLIDGLDGLAAGVASISAVIITTVALATNQYMAAGIAIALLGSSLGFLKYNSSPAQIFMGDSGSMVLGYILAISSIIGVFKSTLTLSVVIPVLIMGIPISDTIFAIIRRIKNKQDIFQADTKHIHHRLLSEGFSTKETVWICYGLSLILGIIAFMMSLVTGLTAQVLFSCVVMLILVSVIAIRRNYKIIFTYLQNKR